MRLFGNIVSWVGVVALFALAIMVNSTSVHDTYWKQITQNKYDEIDGTIKYDLNADHAINSYSELTDLYPIENYDVGTAIRIVATWEDEDGVTQSNTYIYILYKADLFDTNRITTSTFWIQLIVNTLTVVYVYVKFLIDFKESIKTENESLEKEYTELFESEKDIIDSGKKPDLENYLKNIVNLDERLELYIEKLKKRKNKLGRWYVKDRLKKINNIKILIEKYDRYRSALKNLNYEVITNLSNDLEISSLSVNHREVSYDVIFDKVDYRTSKPISMGYSEGQATRAKIMKSPISAIGSVFFAVMAFSTIFITSSDVFQIFTLVLSLIGASAFKISAARQDAKGIVGNKIRALEKTNTTLKVFKNYTPEQLNILRDITLKVKTEKKEVKVNESNTTDTKESLVKGSLGGDLNPKPVDPDIDKHQPLNYGRY